jgi:hypothetical protein
VANFEFKTPASTFLEDSGHAWEMFVHIFELFARLCCDSCNDVVVMDRPPFGWSDNRFVFLMMFFVRMVALGSALFLGQITAHAQITWLSHYSFVAFGGGSQDPAGAGAATTLVGTNNRADNLSHYEIISTRNIAFGSTVLAGTARNSTRVIVDTNFIRVVFSGASSIDASIISEPPSYYSSWINSRASTIVNVEGAQTRYWAKIKNVSPTDGEGNLGSISASYANPTNSNEGAGQTFDSPGEFTGRFPNNGRLDLAFDVFNVSFASRFNSAAHQQAVAEGEIVLGEVVPGDSQKIPIFADRPSTNFQSATIGGAWDAVKPRRWIGPELAYGYRFNFLSNSLCSRIVSFPRGIDADQKFKVFIGNTVLGEFWETNSVDFVQLIGSAVSSFRITGINPTQAAKQDDAFPLQLDFPTATASLVVTPILSSRLHAKVDATGLHLTWRSEQNIWYDVYESTDFNLWSKRASRIPGTGNTIDLPLSSGQPARFFKLAVLDE